MRVDLSNNKIGDIGLRFLIKTLENNENKLVSIKLEGNSFEDKEIMDQFTNVCKKRNIEFTIQQQ